MHGVIRSCQLSWQCGCVQPDDNSGCDVVKVDLASAPTAEASAVLLQALPQAFGAVWPGGLLLLIAHSSACSQPGLYLAQRWARYPVDSWCLRVGELHETGQLHTPPSPLVSAQAYLRTYYPHCPRHNESNLLSSNHSIHFTALANRVCVPQWPRLELSACGRMPPLLAMGGPPGRTPSKGFRAFDDVTRQRVRGVRGLQARTTLETLLARSARYLSAFEVMGAEGLIICLTFKDGSRESKVVAACSRDGLRFSPELGLVLPSTMRAPHEGSSPNRDAEFSLRRRRRPEAEDLAMTHNLAIVRLSNGSYLFAGGTARGKQPFMGIRLLLRQSLLLAPVKGVVTTPEAGRVVIPGTHTGCADRRVHKKPCYSCNAGAAQQPTRSAGLCEFDGRLSLVLHRGRYLLYARANGAVHGQRFVQFASSSDAFEWSPLSRIRIDSYNVSQGDIYFWSVAPNPVDNSSLLAVFPLVHFFKGCVGLSLSLDGARWSSPHPLVACKVHGERASHHPAGGWYRRGQRVHMYIQEDVPDIRVDGLTPWPLAKRLKKEQPLSTLVRYSFSAGSLRRWTAERRGELQTPPTPTPTTAPA